MAAAERRRILGIEHSPPAFAAPPGACDCHVHVFGDPATYPFTADRQYTPGEASLADLRALQAHLGLGRVVIVQPSPYGTDNRCTLDASRALGERARAVAVIDPAAIADRELEAMHAVGVRGVRLNMATSGIDDPAAAGAALAALSRRVAPFGWHVQTYTELAVIAALAEEIAALPTPLVVDHFGRAHAARGTAQDGFAALLDLVRGGNVYVKLSAAYRISERADFADVPEIARALVAAGPERTVWGTDWPHPGGAPRAPELRARVEPFQPIDDGAALNRLARWVPDPVQLGRILVDTPARLYGF